LHEHARIETLCPDSGEAPQIAMQDQRPDDETPFFHVLSRPNPAAAPGRAEPLTDRELEVLRLLAAGKSSQRSARGLVVALGTVKGT
jgi:ATP/maltotriose-dependent transcriptional regulator MalT